MESVRCVSVMISASILCFCIIMTSCLGFVGLLMSSTFKYAMFMCFAYGICIGCVCGVDVGVVFGIVISLLNLAALVVCVVGVFVGAAVLLLVLVLLLLLSLCRQDPVVPPPLGGGGPPATGGLRTYGPRHGPLWFVRLSRAGLGVLCVAACWWCPATNGL